MGKKAVFQAVGSIMLGSNVAIPMYLDAQGLFPNWPYQYHELFGFLAFALFVGWIIFSKQSHINKLESGRPNMTIGNRIKASTSIRESELDILLKILFRNAGTKPAYQAIFKLGIAPAQEPRAFWSLPNETTANPIDPDTDLEFGRDITLRQKTEQDSYGNRKILGAKEWLIYSAIKYSDSPSGGKWYEDEWWFHYKAQGKDLQDATLEQKQQLEQYVRRVFNGD